MQPSQQSQHQPNQQKDCLEKQLQQANAVQQTEQQQQQNEHDSSQVQRNAEPLELRYSQLLEKHKKLEELLQQMVAHSRQDTAEIDSLKEKLELERRRHLEVRQAMHVGYKFFADLCADASAKVREANEKSREADEKFEKAQKDKVEIKTLLAEALLKLRSELEALKEAKPQLRWLDLLSETGRGERHRDSEFDKTDKDAEATLKEYIPKLTKGIEKAAAAVASKSKDVETKGKRKRGENSDSDLGMLATMSAKALKCCDRILQQETEIFANKQKGSNGSSSSKTSARLSSSHGVKLIISLLEPLSMLAGIANTEGRPALSFALARGAAWCSMRSQNYVKQRYNEISNGAGNQQKLSSIVQDVKTMKIKLDDGSLDRVEKHVKLAQHLFRGYKVFEDLAKFQRDFIEFKKGSSTSSSSSVAEVKDIDELFLYHDTKVGQIVQQLQSAITTEKAADARPEKRLRTEDTTAEIKQEKTAEMVDFGV
eukprot:gnl/MRDRNA2_/MRDRNA2_27934_c0_seq1.p1 gnl/MRDRNA2_/MRDRNA2_27934_c0~~gnl/MRDRNA2_/MRDRNA2_27934_c0_seq1.p1  ORF type:complete len:484 (-),score=151.30 gnl/MRDRNA2_/MRDRNA2_27934_c0_seq1:51-1502(-)